MSGVKAKHLKDALQQKEVRRVTRKDLDGIVGVLSAMSCLLSAGHENCRRDAEGQVPGGPCSTQ